MCLTYGEWEAYKGAGTPELDLIERRLAKMRQTVAEQNKSSTNEDGVSA